VKPDGNQSSNALTAIECLGMPLLIVALETHIVTRPVAFLLSPFAVWAGMLLVSPPVVRRNRWRISFLIAGASSIILYVLALYTGK